MSRSVKYRQQAADCDRLAAAMKDPLNKNVLLQMAEQWRELAAIFEKREQRESSKPSK